MNLLARLKQLEKEVERINKPTQEKIVCDYLRLVFSKDEDIETIENNYSKVSHVLPKMHHSQA